MISKIIQKQNFHPGFIGIFVNPFYIARKGLAKHIKNLGASITGKTLDVGCGTKPYEKIFNSSEYIGLEVETSIHTDNKADFFYNGKTFPFNDKDFDSVITNQVLEHVFTPDEFLKEINRVLKLNGNLLLTVPFVWDEHEQPYDYARYSSFGLKYLLENNGFNIKTHIKSVSDFSVIIQLVNAYFYKITVGIPIIKQLAILFIMAPLNLIGIISSLILPNNKDLYLDNIILAQKTKDV